jgi:thiol-disulfide isomerase/thioredoxin
MTLGAELDAFTAEFMTQVPAGIHDIMVKADLALACSGIAGKALQADGIALDFTRPDVHGGIVTLSRLLAGGTVVLSFYRGGWCPYCRIFSASALTWLQFHRKSRTPVCRRQKKIC